MVRADRHDHRAVDVANGREEAFRAAESATRGVEACDLDARTVLEDLQFCKNRAPDLGIQRALVLLEPELLAVLVLVAFLATLTPALAVAALDDPGNRH